MVDDPEEIRERLMRLDSEDVGDAYLLLLRYISTPLKQRSWEEMQTFLPPRPWQYLPLDALDDANFIECGVSIRYPWITKAGEAALKFLEAYGTDSQLWDARMHEAKP